MGIEPIWVYLAATLACTGAFASLSCATQYARAYIVLAIPGAGYLIGPVSASFIFTVPPLLLSDLERFHYVVGSQMWRLTHRKKVSLIDAREKDFHQHVVRNRVDPSRQSATVCSAPFTVTIHFVVLTASSPRTLSRIITVSNSHRSIRKHRTKPLFIGENIGSLKDYRQWLRDQAKYRRKAAWPEDA